MPPQLGTTLPKPVPGAIDYEIIVHTGSKLSAGTDATVSAEITGSMHSAQHTFDQVRGPRVRAFWPLTRARPWCKAHLATLHLTH